jgi:hypothetical protein
MQGHEMNKSFHAGRNRRRNGNQEVTLVLNELITFCANAAVAALR